MALFLRDLDVEADIAMFSGLLWGQVKGCNDLNLHLDFNKLPEFTILDFVHTTDLNTVFGIDCNNFK